MPIVTAPVFAFGRPIVLPRFFPGASTQTRRPFDTLPDGRFVSPIAAGQASGPRSGQEIRVVLNGLTSLAGAARR